MNSMIWKIIKQTLKIVMKKLINYKKNQIIKFIKQKIKIKNMFKKQNL